MSSSFPQQASETYPPEFTDEGDRRILIVDDEKSVRSMFADYLSESYACTTAASAEEALAQLAADSYALVVSDMMMPGRNGVELLREITVKYPDTAVIIVSGIDRSQRVRDALRVGAFDYLIKPCAMEDLEVSVERALERRMLRRTAQKYKADLERQNGELTSSKAELGRLQAQLVHNEKMASMGQLAAGVAHELNNPAGFIYGNMDILKDYLSWIEELLATYDRVAPPPEIAPLVEALKAKIDYADLKSDLNSIIGDCLEGAERIRDIVQNLRLFSRLDEAEVKQIDIHAGIDSTIRLLSRYYISGRLTLHRDYGQLPRVSCYAGQLNQVWMNLLINAAHAIKDKGEVFVSTRLENDLVIATIRDTGCGIPADKLHRIFEPFFTTKRVGEGTGLGLSITYGIIERHGGTITVESHPGTGSTFTITIPVEPNLAARPA